MNAVPAPNIRRRPLIGGLLGLSLVLNVAALCLPFVTVDAAGSDEVIYGLFGSVWMLVDSGMITLAALVVGFSIIFPFAKLSTLTWLWWGGVQTPQRVRWLERVEKLGKWSFFDVFLVAIMVAITNDQWLISSASLTGLTCFMFALMVGMFAGELLTATTPLDPPPVDAPRAPPSLVLLLLVLAIGALLAAALLVPFIQIADWRLTNNDYSLAELVPALWQNESPALALGLGTFLVVTPILNWLTTILMIVGWWRRTPPLGLIRIQHLINRWSMLPVFALSLAVFLAEGHHYLGTEPRAGIWVLVSGLALTVIGQFILARTWRLR